MIVMRTLQLIGGNAHPSIIWGQLRNRWTAGLVIFCALFCSWSGRTAMVAVGADTAEQPKALEAPREPDRERPRDADGRKRPDGPQATPRERKRDLPGAANRPDRLAPRVDERKPHPEQLHRGPQHVEPPASRPDHGPAHHPGAGSPPPRDLPPMDRPGGWRGRMWMNRFGSGVPAGPPMHMWGKGHWKDFDEFEDEDDEGDEEDAEVVIEAMERLLDSPFMHKIVELLHENMELRAEMKVLQTRQEAMQKMHAMELERLKEKMARLEDELRGAQEAAKRARGELEEQRRGWEAELREVAEQREALAEELEHVARERDQLREELERIAREREEVVERRRAEEHELEKLSKVVSEYEHRLGKAKEMVSALTVILQQAPRKEADSDQAVWFEKLGHVVRQLQAAVAR